MRKSVVAYCNECEKKTRHQIIECEDSPVWRIFETVVTLGWGLLLPHDYECECTKCGNIHTVTRGG